MHLSTRVGARPLRQPLLRLHLRRPGHQGHLQPGQVGAQRILIALQFLVLGLRTGLIHQSSHDDWSENNFFVDVLFPNNYGFVVMWMVSILYNVIDHDLSNKVVVFRDC